MPSIKATLGAVLALTTALLATQARGNVTVYQDNCNGNDFSSRYTFNSAVQNAGYSAEFPASAGNMALAERSGLWSQFQTTGYANGNFSDTPISTMPGSTGLPPTAQVQAWSPPPSMAIQKSLMPGRTYPTRLP
jgi:hypothetical protein